MNTSVLKRTSVFFHAFLVSGLLLMLSLTAFAAGTITEIKTVDSNENGKIDHIEVTFSEAVTDATTYAAGTENPAGVAITGYDIIALTGNGTTTLSYEVAEGSEIDSGVLPSITIGVDQLTDVTDDTTPDVIDGVAPHIISAKAISDTQVQITFSENISDASAEGSDFTLSGFADSAINAPASAMETGTANDAVITVTVAGGAITPNDTDGTVALSTAGAISDGDNDSTQITAIDVANEVPSTNNTVTVTSSTTQDEDGDGKIDRVVVVFSGDTTDNGNYQTGIDTNAGLSVTGYDITKLSGNGTNTITYTITEASHDTGALPDLVFKSDNFSNLDTTGAPNIAADGASPIIVSAQAKNDTTIEITLSESIDRTQLLTSDFEVRDDDSDDLGTTTITNIQKTDSGNTITVTIVGPIRSTFTSRADNTVNFDSSGGVEDIAGNGNSGRPLVDIIDRENSQDNSSSNSSSSSTSNNNDDIKVTSVLTGDQDENGRIDTITVTFEDDVEDKGDYKKGSDDDAGFEVEDYDIIKLEGNKSKTLTYTLDEKDDPDSDATPKVTFKQSNFEEDIDDDNTTEAEDGAPVSIIKAVVLEENKIRIDLSETIENDQLKKNEITLEGDDLGNTEVTEIEYYQSQNQETKSVIITIEGDIKSEPRDDNTVSFAEKGDIKDLEKNANEKTPKVTLQWQEDDNSEEVDQERQRTDTESDNEEEQESSNNQASPDTFEDHGFSDINSYKFKNSIGYLRSKGVLDAKPRYYPNAPLKRSEFAKIVIGAKYGHDLDEYAKKCFGDFLDQADWFYKYFCFAKEKNFIKGYADGTAGADRNITLPEALSILLKVFEKDIENYSSQWFENALYTADKLGAYYPAKYNPVMHEVTRGEMAYLAAWFLAKDTGETPPDQIDDFNL